jgi:hypothetical protein
LADGKPGNFPLYPASTTNIEPISKKIPQFEGHTTLMTGAEVNLLFLHPLPQEKTFVLSPEDPERRIKIVSETDEENLMLFDGRNLAQNGWFVVRSLLPANKTGKVLTWYVEPNAIPNWIRKPVIEFSQVGYNPQQEKQR